MSVQLIKDWGLPYDDDVACVQSARNHDAFTNRFYSAEIDQNTMEERIALLTGIDRNRIQTTNAKHAKIMYCYALQLTIRTDLTGEALWNDVVRRTASMVANSPWSITVYETYSPEDTGKPKMDAAGNPKQKKGAKRTKAIEVYKANIDKNMTRKEWIALLVAEVGLTKAGASTYYASLKGNKMK